jgi:hypothetical protein
LPKERPRELNSLAEKLDSAASGAKAFTGKEDFIAALKALRHPKASFSANCEARTILPTNAALKAPLFHGSSMQ